MKHRCKNPSYYLFHRYGGRGIKVCDRWNDNFDAFLEDMGEAPTSDHSLDRIDPDGDYCPENCRWATHVDQANNRSSNRLIEHEGESKTLAQWAKELDIDYSVLQVRLDRGWPVEEAFNKPVNAPRYVYETPDGVFTDQYEIAAKYGIKLKTVSARFCSKTFTSWTKRKARHDDLTGAA